MTVRKTTAKKPTTQFLAHIVDSDGQSMVTQLYPTEEALRKALVTDYLGDDRSDYTASNMYLADDAVQDACITIYQIVGKPKEVCAEVAGIKLTDVVSL